MSFLLKIFFLVSASPYLLAAKAQDPVNWTEKQLMKPADLANVLNDKKDIPVIISVGPGAPIPNSIDVGAVNNTEGLQKLNASLKLLPKNKKVVVYCGCCPYKHCPNVRPAIDALKTLRFTNYYLLDLPNNIRTDWIAKGYPVSN